MESFDYIYALHSKKDIITEDVKEFSILCEKLTTTITNFEELFSVP